MRIIQIVPRLPPVVDGVGDYAWTLARNLADHHGVHTTFVVCDPAKTDAGQEENNGLISVVTLRCQSAESLVESVGSLPSEMPILLHYVQYGYARKGCPIWLERGLQTLCKERMRPLVTMFHELYAPGHFPDSAFWLKPVQKTIARRIARLSRVCVTSRETYAEELTSLLGHKRPLTENLPIPSGVGEGEGRLAFRDRRPYMVIFGQSGTRARAYQEFLCDLENACRQLCIEKIIDIGPAFGSIPTFVGGLPVEAHGSLGLSAIRNLLQKSLAGFLVYDLEYLGRSSVFAAYCAYGVAPVCVHINRKARAANKVRWQDGLESGTHFWENEPYTAGPLDFTTAQRVASEARSWYQPHNQAAHAERFHTVMRRYAEPLRERNLDNRP